MIGARRRTTEPAMRINGDAMGVGPSFVLSRQCPTRFCIRRSCGSSSFFVVVVVVVVVVDVVVGCALIPFVLIKRAGAGSRSGPVTFESI